MQVANERMSTKTRFEKEAKGSSEMAYYVDNPERTNQNLKQVRSDVKRGKTRANESRLVSFIFTSDWMKKIARDF